MPLIEEETVGGFKGPASKLICFLGFFNKRFEIFRTLTHFISRFKHLGISNLSSTFA